VDGKHRFCTIGQKEPSRTKLTAQLNPGTSQAAGKKVRSGLEKVELPPDRAERNCQKNYLEDSEMQTMRRSVSEG